MAFPAHLSVAFRQRLWHRFLLVSGLFLFVTLSCQVSLEYKPASPAGARVADQPPVVLGYFPSWSETQLTNGTSQFTAIPAHVTHLFFSFAKPNLRYVKGSYDLSQTGIEVHYDGQTLKTALSIVGQKGIKVLLSIGGETYWGAADAYNINYPMIKDLVDDFGFAGIDWDFEPNGSFTDIGSAANVARFIQFINQSRQLMPRSAGYLIACAPAGCGALGGQTNDDPGTTYAYARRNQLTGDADSFLYAFSDPQHTISIFGFSSTGHMIPVFNAAGSNLDLVAFQGYNVGATKDRTLMYNAYASYANRYGFRVVAGTHVPNEPWGPYYTYSAHNTANLAEYIRGGGLENRAGKGDGIMIWQVLAQSALAADARYTGVTYLNVASKVLNGATPAVAIAAAFDYQTNPPASNVPAAPIVLTPNAVTNTPITGTSVPGTLLIQKDGTQLTTLIITGTTWSYTPASAGTYTVKIQTSGGTSAASVPIIVTTDASGGCSYPAYNAGRSYPTAGTRVYYNQAIYENKWWANPGETPKSTDSWGVWKFVQTCSDGPIANNPPAAPTPASFSVAVGSAVTGSVAVPGTLLILKDGTQLATQALSGTTWSYTPTSTGSYSFKLQNASGTSVASSPVTVYSPAPVNQGGCNAPAYDKTKTYPTAGTRVLYQGRVFESKWYINPGQVPDQTDTWGPWKFIQNCQ